jgi:membrane-associated PAP2 superfamily phosphatase
MVLGWSTASYKMLIGDHFLSHTVVTMILAWLIILLIVAVVNKYETLFNKNISR